MAGFTGVSTFTNQDRLPTESDLKQICGEDASVLTTSWFAIAYRTNDQFSDDKVFRANEEEAYGLDGVVLNLKQLCDEYGQDTPFNLVKTLYKKYGPSFPKDLKGEFCGFYGDEQAENLALFSNQTNTKTFFYTYKEGALWFANRMDHLVNLLKRHGIAPALFEESAYCLLTYGYMLEGNTLFKEVKKLNPGSFLFFSKEGLKELAYHDFKGVEITERAEQYWMASLEERFNTALQLEYEKDEAYQVPRHLSLISGGLDSRLNTMCAHKMGYTNKVNFCFSNPGYWDHTISRSIAKYMEEPYQFYPLDGSYLCDIEENVALHNNSALYYSAAHVNEAFHALDFSQFGLIHSGQIGDGMLGSLLTSPENPPPHLTSGMASKQLASRIRPFIEGIQKNYEREEIFLLFNKVFNGTHCGSWVSGQFSYLVSPFMDVDFMETSLSIPPGLKYFQAIYIQWLRKYHPEVCRFRWERTKLKPDRVWKTKAGELINMVQAVLFKKILKKEAFITMAPYDQWYRNKAHIRNCLEGYYTEHQNLLDPWPELRADAGFLFQNGNVGEKVQVITLLESIKQHLSH